MIFFGGWGFLWEMGFLRELFFKESFSLVFLGGEFLGILVDTFLSFLGDFLGEKGDLEEKFLWQNFVWIRKEFFLDGNFDFFDGLFVFRGVFLKRPGGFWGDLGLVLQENVINITFQSIQLK